MMCGKSMAHIQTSPHTFISPLKSAAQKINFSHQDAEAHPDLKLKGAVIWNPVLLPVPC